MDVCEKLRDLVAASSAEVLAAIDEVPDDEAFTTTQDESGKTAADYALLVAQDKAMISTGLGSQTVPEVPPVLSSRSLAKSTIEDLEQDLEDQIVRLTPDDYSGPPSTLGYPIDCDLETYYDCVVAHSNRDNERANAIRAIFDE